MYTYVGSIELNITKKQAKQAFHQGDCELDIIDLMKEPKIKKQLDNINVGLLIDTLKEYGAWYDDELNSHNDNLARLLWIACGNICEDI